MKIKSVGGRNNVDEWRGGTIFNEQKEEQKTDKREKGEEHTQKKLTKKTKRTKGMQTRRRPGTKHTQDTRKARTRGVDKKHKQMGE